MQYTDRKQASPQLGCRLPSVWAQQLQCVGLVCYGMWDHSFLTEIEPVSPALEGRFSTTGPPEKSLPTFKIRLSFSYLYKKTFSYSANDPFVTCSANISQWLDFPTLTGVFQWIENLNVDVVQLVHLYFLSSVFVFC